MPVKQQTHATDNRTNPHLGNPRLEFTCCVLRCRMLNGKLRVMHVGVGSSGSGGVRVIYYNRPANGEIWLLLMYSKSARENISAHILKAIQAEIENA